jgi:lantibiotic modifying enzyme
VIARSGVAGPAPGQAGDAVPAGPVLRDLSPCHGELGVIEALTVLADTTGDQAVAAVARRRAGMVLGAIDRYGLSCGTPRWVSTPGLLNGWAGIGYGLLRLGFTGRVPSVLLLQPGQSTKGRHHV